MGYDAARRMPPTNVDADPTEGDSAELFERAADEEGPAVEREAARVLSAVESRLFGSTVEAAKVGRFTLLEQIGSGGAGMVWAAYDPRLDRKVALKLLRMRTDQSSPAKARLIREAQVAGRLSHPNIVSVFDVGEYEGSAYITMEFIDGPDLARWLKDAERSNEVVLDVFVQAGRGLAEAHRNGVIHRDFKPANVMVQLSGAEPRARVVDFGLAGWDDAGSSHHDAPLAGALDSGSLTATGRRVGTPAYMSPEQAAGQRATERSDQFSFCLSLVEGFTGRRPFDGVDDYALPKDALDGVPAWMHGALERGLQRDVEARWPTMDALLAELEPPSQSRRRLTILVGSVGLLGIAVALGMQDASTEELAVCTGTPDELTGIWDDATKDSLQSALLESGIAYAPDVWDRIAPRIDGWTERWSAMHREACEATHVRRVQSEAALDQRMLCLQRAKLDLVATTELLGKPTDEVIENAHELVAGLPSIDLCADLEALQRGDVHLSAEDNERVLEVQRLVAEAQANMEATLLDAALAAIERAEQTATGLAAPALASEIWLVAAQIRTLRGEHEEAEQLMRKVHAHAAEHQQWGALRNATAMLMDNLGNRQGRASEALPMRDLALGLSMQSPLDEAETRTILGNVLQGAGEYDDAEAELRKSLELRLAELPEDDVLVAESQAALAGVLAKQKKMEEAEAQARASLASRLAALGPHHPSVGTSRVSLATILHGAGKLDEAEQLLVEGLEAAEQALPEAHPQRSLFYINLAAIAHARGDLQIAETMTRQAVGALEAAHGPHHPNLIASINNLAMILSMQGRFDEAEVEFEKALQRRIDSLGPEHPDVARSHNNLGGFLQEQGRYKEAERHFQASLEVHQATLRETHPDIASAHMVLGSVQRIQDDWASALGHFEECLAIREQELGPSHPEVAKVLANLGRAQRELGRYDEAEAALRRAIEIREAKLDPAATLIADVWLALGATLDRAGKTKPASEAHARAWEILNSPADDPRERGKAVFLRARTMWEVRSERGLARKVAERALELYREAKASKAVQQVETWLEEHAV